MAHIWRLCVACISFAVLAFTADAANFATHVTYGHPTTATSSYHPSPFNKSPTGIRVHPPCNPGPKHVPCR
jgi:hypothetical protein